MSIHFISGKPRGGKTLYSVKLIVDELVHGRRPVVTNVPLDLGRLNEYLQEKYPKACVNIHERVLMLSDEDAGKFWTVRPGFRAEVLSAQDWDSGRFPDFAGRKDEGVMYVIDEIHNFFNARLWAKTGRDVLFYLSQHGKLGDTLICITQHVGNVDKQFRSVTQDYTYLRNLTKERMGLFRLPAVFVRKSYLQPATDTSVPCESGTFRLDVSGLASCYDTAQGVGIHGRAADKGEKRSGIPWYVFVIVVPVLIIGVVVYGPRMAVAAISPSAVAVAANPVASFKSNVVAVAGASVVPVVSVAPVASTNALRVTGGVSWGSWCQLSLSDGRVLDSRRGECAFDPKRNRIVSIAESLPAYQL